VGSVEQTRYHCPGVQGRSEVVAVVPELAPQEQPSPELVRDRQVWADDYPWLHQALSGVGVDARGASDRWWTRIEGELKATLDFKVRPDGTAVVWCGMSGHDFHHGPTPKELFEGLAEAYQRERKRVGDAHARKRSAAAREGRCDSAKLQAPIQVFLACACLPYPNTRGHIRASPGAARGDFPRDGGTDPRPIFCRAHGTLSLCRRSLGSGVWQGVGTKVCGDGGEIAKCGQLHSDRIAVQRYRAHEGSCERPRRLLWRDEERGLQPRLASHSPNR
jgi:hypothetical protein